LTTASQPPRSGATHTVPQGLRGGTFEGPDVVTSLLLYDAGTDHPLDGAKGQFVVGSAPECDIAIESAFVSARHCRLERKASGLEVMDLGSKNGTYFEGRREDEFHLRPGKTFVVGALPHRFLALNDEMRTLYPTLIDILGEPDAHAIRSETPSPSDLILAAVGGAHMLITSEPHCEQNRLAGIVHRCSLLRSRPLVEVEQVPVDRGKQLDLIRDQAAQSTLVLEIGDNDVRLPSGFVTAAFSTRYQVRVIVLARNYDVAAEALGERYVRQMQTVALRPVASRRASIDRLLDRMLMERECALRVADMTPENQDALRAHRWPDNFASLREAADRLSAIVRFGSIHKAALARRIPPATFYHWYSKIVRLSHPLTPTATYR
jgi:hypothetical protein